jgi:hypothetical protein
LLKDLLILLGAVLVFFRKVLFVDDFSIPWDFRTFHLPVANAVAEALRTGQSPLWDPYTYCGRPLFADPQAQLFYPPTLLMTWLFNLFPAVPLEDWMTWQLVLHVFAAGAFTYLLLRRMELSGAAALCGGLAFAMGGFFASQTEHLGAIDAAAWIPLLWMAVWELRGGFSRWWFALLAISGAMCLLAGFPAVAVTGFMSAVIFAALISQRRMWLATVGLLLAAGVAAILLLPAAQLTMLSVARYRTDWLDGMGLPLQSLISLILPNHYHVFDLRQYHERWDPTSIYLYCGIGVLALAAYGLTTRKYAVAAMTVLSGIWMFGTLTPFGKLVLVATPKLLRGSIYPQYAEATFCLGVALMAGFGLEALRRIGPRAKYAIALAVGIDLLLVSSGRPTNASDVRHDPTFTSRQINGSAGMSNELHYLSGKSNPPARFDTVQTSSSVWVTTAPQMRLYTASGYNPMALERLIQVRLSFAKGYRWGAWYEAENTDSPVLDLLSVRFVIAGRPIAPGRLAKAGVFPGVQLYENPHALPRFWLVHRVRRVSVMDEAIREIRRPDFEASTEAVVEGADALDSGAAGSGRVETVQDSAGFLALRTHDTSAAYLATSEANYPGWRAFVDGAEVPIYTTNVAFRGLFVPAGDHTVTFRFTPRILWAGAAVSVFAVGILAGLCFLRGQ